MLQSRYHFARRTLEPEGYKTKILPMFCSIKSLTFFFKSAVHIMLLYLLYSFVLTKEVGTFTGRLDIPRETHQLSVLFMSAINPKSEVPQTDIPVPQLCPFSNKIFYVFFFAKHYFPNSLKLYTHVSSHTTITYYVEYLSSYSYSFRPSNCVISLQQTYSNINGFI
jgi:hypothetical protein